jgi:hypothetical protein
MSTVLISSRHKTNEPRRRHTTAYTFDSLSRRAEWEGKDAVPLSDVFFYRSLDFARWSNLGRKMELDERYVAVVDVQISLTSPSLEICLICDDVLEVEPCREDDSLQQRRDAHAFRRIREQCMAFDSMSAHATDSIWTTCLQSTPQFSPPRRKYWRSDAH